MSDARHDARENESVFDGPVIIVPDLVHSDEEAPLRGIGRTRSGRHAFIVFTIRGDRLRPLSARYMHRREVGRYEETMPDFASDAEAEDFVATADLSEYDLAGTPVRFELGGKDRTMSLRLPERLLTEVKAHAEKAQMPVQRFIRLAIENAIAGPRPR